MQRQCILIYATQGREGNLQLQLGRPSTGPNAVAVQRRVIPGNPDDNQVVQFKDTF